jgi:hypothetical protein
MPSVVPPRAHFNEAVEPVTEAELAAVVRPSRVPLFVALAVVLALLVGVGVVFLGGEKTPTPAPEKPKPVVAAPVAPEPPKPEVAKTVWLDVVTNPAGAEVKRGAEVLGLTPLHVSLERAEGLARLEVMLAKYQPEIREVALTADEKLSIELKPVPSSDKAPKKLAPPKKKPPARKKK